jgi:uncharacterized protein YdhG (YjbR/CyaY superfamily)
MANTDFKSVDEYFLSRPEAVRPVLERIRAAIRKALPAAEVAISYQIPTFKVNGRPAIYFAVWKEHYSLYPASDPLIDAFKDVLAPGVVEKRTLKFPLSAPVPARLIGRIAKFRAQEIDALVARPSRSRKTKGA